MLHLRDVDTQAGIVSKGGAYLLNVAPDSEGVMPQPSQDTLRAVGQWLKVNGESIYGAGRSPFGQYSATQKDRAGKPVFRARRDWRCTTKPGRLYVHLFKGPDSAFELTGVQERVAKAYLPGGLTAHAAPDHADRNRSFCGPAKDGAGPGRFGQLHRVGGQVDRAGRRR